MLFRFSLLEDSSEDKGDGVGGLTSRADVFHVLHLIRHFERVSILGGVLGRR